MIEYLKQWLKDVEGTNPQGLTVPYTDATGNKTVGWGYKIKPTDKFTKYTPELLEGLLQQEATKSLTDVSKAVKKPVWDSLNEEQKVALASFHYNVGGGNFLGSSLLRYLNQGRIDEAGNELGKWIYGRKMINGKETKQVIPGLVNRRNKELELFFSHRNKKK